MQLILTIDQRRKQQVHNFCLFTGNNIMFIKLFEAFLFVWYLNKKGENNYEI